MPHFAPRRLAPVTLFAAVLALVLVALPSGHAAAHNTLISSDPADGASLPAAPSQVTWNFDNSVPLETMTVTLIDASGARTELAGSVHGAAGDTQVITPLPTLSSGGVSVRWRLVGPDGHPITGRVDFTITAAPATTAPAVVAPASTAPAAPPSAPPSAAPSAVDPTPAESDGGAVDDGFSTPGIVRWLLRYGSYLSIMAAVGILFTGAFVWPGAASHPLLRWILGRSLIATAILSFLQLLVVASDVSGEAPWSSLGEIEVATTTYAAMAYALRIALAVAMWIVLFGYRITHHDVYWTAVSLPGVGLLATWAFAGHSRSMRWPMVGVTTDVAHHAAAAAWIAGLAIVGMVVIPTTTAAVTVPAVRNFSRVAAVSVGVLVATGLVQTLRLVGGPSALLDAKHGRYLAVKLVVLAVMLAFANANRRRVDRRLNDADSFGHHVGALRQSILAEFAIGLVIIGITAAMVVSPPATGTSEVGAVPDAPRDSAIYYTM